MTNNKMLEKLATLRTVKLQPQHQAQFDIVFESLLNEMDTPSALSVVLIEQIAECLFWIKQHNNDKEEIICYAMGEELVKTLNFIDKEYVEAITHTIKQILQGHDVKATEPERYARFEEIMNKRGMTLSTLRAKAMLARMDKIDDLDAIITRHIQNLRHLQKGLDAVDIKKRMLKRLDLEIQQLTDEARQQREHSLEPQLESALEHSSKKKADAIDHQS